MTRLPEPIDTTDATDRGVPLTLAAGLASTAAFAVGCVLTQAVTVPSWRRMEPEMFLEEFATAGPATGAVLFPVEVAAVGLLGAATVAAVRHRQPGRLMLAAATAAIVGTVLLLPAFFAGANAAFLRPDFPVDAVPAALADWNRWNWIRTGLGVAATVLGAASALLARRRVRSRILSATGG
jgi:hypothetical protein